MQVATHWAGALALAGDIAGEKMQVVHHPVAASCPATQRCAGDPDEARPA